MNIQEIKYCNSVEYVWLLIDKFDSREITESEFVHNIIQEWMMEVPRDDITGELE